MHFIETAKGWSTKEILDMPLCRVRQVLELILQDKHEAAKFQAQIVEWQTKIICGMFTVVAADNKQANQIIKAVKKMHLPLSDEEADVIDTRSFGEVVEEGAKPDLESQPSFEALEAAFQHM